MPKEPDQLNFLDKRKENLILCCLESSEVVLCLYKSGSWEHEETPGMLRLPNYGGWRQTWE